MDKLEIHKVWATAAIAAIILTGLIALIYAGYANSVDRDKKAIEAGLHQSTVQGSDQLVWTK